MTPEEIKKWRKELGISQEKLAQLLGVSFGTINRWERGACKPSRLALDKIEAIISNQIRGDNEQS